MHKKNESRALGAAVALAALLVACTSTAPSTTESEPAAPAESAAPAEPAAPDETGEATPFIVQGTDLAAVTAAVKEVGATVTHELKIIRAVGARLTAAQRAALEQHPAVTRIYEDRKVGINAGRNQH